MQVRRLHGRPSSQASRQHALRSADGAARLARYYPRPGLLEGKRTSYLATGLTEGKQTPTEDERIEMRWFAAREVDNLIRARKVRDAKTQIGFLKWKRYGAA